MKLTDSALNSILLENKLLNNEDISLAQKSSKAQGVSLYKYISDAGLVRDDQLGQLIANYYNLPFINLGQISVKDEILKIVPEVVARKQNVICFSRDKDGLHVASSRPDNLAVFELIKKKTGDKIVRYYATERNIRDAINLYTRDAALAFEDILAENIKQARENRGKLIDLPIIKIVDTIIEYAYGNKASDVHIEPEEDYSL